MRYLKVLFLSLALIGLAFGSAAAGVLNINTSFTTAAEGIGLTCANDMDLDSDINTPLGNALGTFITYSPGIALNIGDKLTFTLTNGTFRDTMYYLLVDEDQAGVGDLDGAVAGELQEVGNRYPVAPVHPLLLSVLPISTLEQIGSFIWSQATQMPIAALMWTSPMPITRT